MQEDKKDVKYDIEKVADYLQTVKRSDHAEIVFDHEGNMHKNNRKYRRDSRHAQRASIEGQKSLKFYTKKKNSHLKEKRKKERQNRRLGRK